jgi:hypothetical protein
MGSYITRAEPETPICGPPPATDRDVRLALFADYLERQYNEELSDTDDEQELPQAEVSAYIHDLFKLHGEKRAEASTYALLSQMWTTARDSCKGAPPPINVHARTILTQMVVVLTETGANPPPELDFFPTHSRGEFTAAFIDVANHLLREPEPGQPRRSARIAAKGSE